MNLRKLKEKDAEFMLEWMQDYEVIKDLFTDFSKKTIDDCISFIQQSAIDIENIHLAIVDDKDTYMGTVSLKHINTEQKSAEFAITIRKRAMGKGYSIFGMNQIFEIAKKEWNLDIVYWCVLKKNLRAIRFYNKYKFELCWDIPSIYKELYGKDILENLIWYRKQF